MALDIDPDAIKAMEDTNTGAWVVTAYYGADQTIPSAKFPGMESVPVTTDGQITFDASGQIQANGTLYLARDGQSLVPEALTDPLAPFGQELQIVRRVTYSDQSWDIPLGPFRIQDVPDMAAYYRAWPNARETVGWSAQLNVCDRFDALQAASFLAVKGPTPGNTSWDEIQGLSTIPLVKSLPDASIPSGITYSDRLDAIVKLISNLGGEPALTRQGALTARKANAWLTETAPVAVVNGTVQVSGGMSNDIKNSVAVTNPTDEKILATAKISDASNPLRTTGPLGERSYELSDPLMDTQAKAQAAAATTLARLSSQQSRTITFKCLPRPDLELGDFIQVNDLQSGDQYTGELRRMVFSLDPTQLMSGELTVAEKL